MFDMTTEKVFHADDKYVLRLLNVVIHEKKFPRVWIQKRLKDVMLEYCIRPKKNVCFRLHGLQN